MILNKEAIDFFLRGIRILDSYHKDGVVLCQYLNEWKNRDLGWHKAIFPPEYKKACLSGSEFIPDFSCDLYMFMVYCYENFLGDNPPINFQIKSNWKEKHDLTEGDSTCVEAAFFRLFERSTRRNTKKRFANATELVETSSFTLIKNSKGHHQENGQQTQIHCLYDSKGLNIEDVFGTYDCAKTNSNLKPHGV